MRATWPAAVSLALLTTVTACGGEPDSSTRTASPSPTATSSAPGSATASAPASTPAATPTATPTGPTKVIGTVATGLEVPWGIAFLPDGSALVTERDSRRLLRIAAGKVTEIGVIDAKPEGEAGVLGVAVSPDFATNQRIFVYATTGTDNRVLSMRLRNDALSDVKPILTGIPRGFIHDGGRMVFGPDGALYVSTGETGNAELSQDPDSLAGKILRINEQGKAFSGSSRIWTLGHRNVQGLAFDPRGRLWASEFGSQEWDELNLIRRGRNYGWPRVEGTGSQREFTNPLAVWRVEDASPSGLAFAGGSLWMGALRGGRLWQIPLAGDGIGKPVAHFVGRFGRLRTVVLAPDGNLWVSTSNRDGRGNPRRGDDRILLVRPGR